MDEALLKRPIKDGSKYNKYFGSQCESTFLGNGNTDLSITVMARWVNKYKDQCKQLALNEFSNLSLEKTAAEIYKFLYNHIQYKLDGETQKIRSPFCSWLDRKNGIDCKSYSVFASCILSNLGIVHYLRKTKQPGFNSDQFTHVYVVVPVNQKSYNLKDGYYIIDATLHTNYELPFVEAKDKLMSKVGLPHYGLGFADPVQMSTSCSCNTHKMQPLGVPLNVLPQAIETFKKFLYRLEQNGVQRSVTQKALSNLQVALSQGKDPKFKDLFETSTGLGLGMLPFGLGASDTDGTGSDTQANTTQSENDYIETVLSNIDSDSWFESTFGSVFGNGWNFSCWGSSYNPTKGKDDAQRLIKLAAQRLQNPPTPDTFNEWNRFIHEQIGYANAAYSNGNLANCSRDGYKLLLDLLKEHKSQTFTALRGSGYTFNMVQSRALVRNRDGSIAQFINENQQFFRYDIYEMVVPVGGSITLPIDPVNYGPGTNTGNNYPTTTGSNTQQASSTPVMVGAGLLALLAANYFYQKRKKASA